MHPVLRGSAQNPDVFFQARGSEPFCGVARRRAGAMDRLAERTVARTTCSTTSAIRRLRARAGGLGCGAAEEAVEAMVDGGERVGLVEVRLFRFSRRPRSLPRCLDHPSGSVLDRTKEPGALGSRCTRMS